MCSLASILMIIQKARRTKNRSRVWVFVYYSGISILLILIMECPAPNQIFKPLLNEKRRAMKPASLPDEPGYLPLLFLSKEVT